MGIFSPVGEVVQIIPDLQIPFEHPDALEFCAAINQKYKPSRIIVIGDEIDQHALGEYDSDPDGMSAGEELELAVERLGAWYKVFPIAKVCESNHTDRIFRRAFKWGIPKAYLKDYRDFLGAPRHWVWKEHFIIDKIRYEHGHNLGGGSGRNATYQLPLFNRQSTAFGHFHSFGGIQYLANDIGGMLFGFNVGCLIDIKKYAFHYARKIKAKPTLGGGIIGGGVPHFIPMILDRHERWIGKL